MGFIAFLTIICMVLLSVFLWPEWKKYRSTKELVKRCRSSKRTSAGEWNRLIENGADVSVNGPSMLMPVLSQLVIIPDIEGIRACMNSNLPLDFSLTDGHGNTPLHCICHENVSDLCAKEILSLFVLRLETHPLDKCDWGIVNHHGDDFLSLVASRQLLSVLFPLLKNVPFYADSVAPLPITRKVWQWDWEQLSPEDQANLKIPDEIIKADRYTSKLFKLANEDFPDLTEVQNCVKNGADVCFHVPGSYWPILHRFIFAGNVECVAACLKSPNPINFTCTDRYKCTPLHFICRNSLDNKKSEVEILRLILDRLDSGLNSDSVNWEQQNSVGMDFLHHVVFSERLSVVWPIVKKRVSYFRDHSFPIPITCRIYRSDWNQLTPEEQQQFEPHAGFEY